MGINLINDNLVAANARARFYNATPATADGSSRVLFDAIDFNVGDGFTLDTANREVVCNFDGYVKVNVDLATTAGSLISCRISLNNGVEYAIGFPNAGGTRSMSSAMIAVSKGDRISVKDAGGATYGGASWDMNLDIHRLADYSAGQPAGFALASASVYGLVKAGAIPGSTTGDAIAAGYIGERLEFTARSISSTAGNYIANASALTTLTPGVWLIFYTGGWAGVNTSNHLLFAISTNNNNDGADLLTLTAAINNQNASAANNALVAGATGYYLATASTPIYAKFYSEDQSSLSCSIDGYAVRIA